MTWLKCVREHSAPGCGWPGIHKCICINKPNRNRNGTNWSEACSEQQEAKTSQTSKTSFNGQVSHSVGPLLLLFLPLEHAARCPGLNATLNGPKGLDTTATATETAQHLQNGQK